MHGVDNQQRADLPSEAPRERNVVDRSERIRRRADGEQLGARRDLGGHVGGVQFTGFQQAHFAHHRAALREAGPRTAVRLVVELGDEHLVALAQGAADRGAQGEIERGHVLTERDARTAFRAEKGGDHAARRLHAPVHLARGCEIAVRVHVAGGVDVRDGVDHDARHLAAARSVEEGEAGILRERREILPAAQAVIERVGHYSRS